MEDKDLVQGLDLVNLPESYENFIGVTQDVESCIATRSDISDIVAKDFLITDLIADSSTHTYEKDDSQKTEEVVVTKDISGLIPLLKSDEDANVKIRTELAKELVDKLLDEGYITFERKVTHLGRPTISAKILAVQQEDY